MTAPGHITSDDLRRSLQSVLLVCMGMPRLIRSDARRRHAQAILREACAVLHTPVAPCPECLRRMADAADAAAAARPGYRRDLEG